VIDTRWNMRSAPHRVARARIALGTTIRKPLS